ncbi:hypothetical protein B0H10DRAFT_1642280, partial [Mycena sp. CBHHK59/15]
TTADDCGALSVMKVPDVLPEGVNPTDIRKCAGHPLEINGTRANRDGFQGKYETVIRTDSYLMPTIVGLIGRNCVTGASVGCTQSNGVWFCWKVCGPGGEWCWTASNGGFGGWDTCISAKDCGTD